MGGRGVPRPYGGGFYYGEPWRAATIAPVARTLNF